MQALQELAIDFGAHPGEQIQIAGFIIGAQHAGEVLVFLRRVDYDRDKDDPLAPILKDIAADVGNALLARFRVRAPTT